MSVGLQTGGFIKLKASPFKNGRPLFFRFGLSYFSNTTLFTAANGAYLKTTRSPAYSNTSGLVIDQDTITMKHLSLTYQNQNINLETALLLSMNNGKRIAFKYGVGIMAGINYNGRSEIVYRSYKVVSDFIQASHEIINTNYIEKEDESQLIKNPANFSFGGSLTLGYVIKINPAIGFFNELRFGYRTDKISNYKFTETKIYQLMFGINYSWQKHLNHARYIFY